MAARAMWKGVVRFGKVRLPVKLYSALLDRNIHFHLLHDQDMVRLRQRMVNPETDETVEFSEARRGYEIDRELFVIVDDEELEALEPESSRDIEIMQFVPTGEIEHAWYDRPYYLGPDENDADYFAFAEALAKTDSEGVARWTMRKKEYFGALRTEGDYLMLVTLRHDGEIIEASELEPPTGRDLDKKERQLARQLMETLQDEFRPDDYRDEYRSRVRKLIETKRKGGEIEILEPEEKPKRQSLSEALKASLKARNGKRK